MWDVTDGDVPGHATAECVPDVQQLLVLQAAAEAKLPQAVMVLIQMVAMVAQDML